MADLRIPEDKALEVFELAARLYARQHQSYSARALSKSAADIPPEYIQRALSQLQAREEAAQARKCRWEDRQQWVQIGGVAAVGVALGWGILTYNSLSKASQRVDSAWSQVETQFQARANLIPTLVDVTKDSARPAKDWAALLNQAFQNYNAAATQPEKVAAAEEINQALAQVQTTVLATPQLQSNQRYKGLQTNLTVSENRVAAECARYNQSVVQYNQQVQAFPSSLVVELLGFAPQPLFEISSQEASSPVPQPAELGLLQAGVKSD